MKSRNILNGGTVARLRLLSSRAVTILLCTFNGERFLAEQLDSIERQAFANRRLITSDDGSSDRTRLLLDAFKVSPEPGKVEIIDGPRRDAAANFLFLACRDGLVSDYYAFRDQDDVWEVDHLARAIGILEETSANVAAIYGSRTCLIDEAGQEIGLSALLSKLPTFRSALVQSIAGGNTVVFNEKARELLAFCGDGVVVPSHDWRLYRVTSACDGSVYYDAYPSVHYRQRERNVIGSNMGFAACMRRLSCSTKGVSAIGSYVAYAA